MNAQLTLASKYSIRLSRVVSFSFRTARRDRHDISETSTCDVEQNDLHKNELVNSLMTVLLQKVSEGYIHLHAIGQ